MKHAAIRLVCAALAAAGCQSRIDAPSPDVASVAPTLVCDEQLTTEVLVGGSGFTPLATRTLGGTGGMQQPEVLQLPAITLVPRSALDGSAPTAPKVNVADDPDAPTLSHVRWHSEEEMAFDVYPTLELKDGLFDVQVENPGGESATLASALAAVPRPHINMVSPSPVCDAQRAIDVTLTGLTFVQLDQKLPTVTLTDGSGNATTLPTKGLTGCTMIPFAQVCTGVSFTLAQNQLMTGSYQVQVTNPAPAACSSTDPAPLTVEPPPTIVKVLPATVCAGGGVIDVQGVGFAPGAQVTVGTVQAMPVMVDSSTELHATLSGPFVAGTTYDLTVDNGDGCTTTLPGAVTAVPGPIAFFTDPPVVYNGISTQVTIYVTALAPPVTTVSLVPQMGGMPIVLSAMIDPQHPKRILAVVPKSTPAGVYNLTVDDSTGCPALLAGAVTVVDKATVTLSRITPSFGGQTQATPVEIDANAGGLVPTPRAYLNPSAAGPSTAATALSSVAFDSPNRLTAIVPAGLDPAGNPYDLIVVNPDSTVGVLTAAYTSTANAPPVIYSISPGAVPSTGPPPVTISGANFNLKPNVTVTLMCAGFAPTTPTITASSASSITIDVNGKTNGSPNVCVVRVTNLPDMSFADFSALAVSNASGNLSLSQPGTMLPAPRRAPSLLAASATSAARYLYTIGGDGGTPATALDSVVSTVALSTGTGASWATQRYSLARPRTLAGSAALGRYLYIVGGNDGTGPVATVERALVLDPQQAPTVTDIDVTPGGGVGLDGGIWYYRVAALLPMSDPDNPGGETLPSDEAVLQLPSKPEKVQVKLTWSAVTGASGYRIYRTATAGMIAGQELPLSDVGGGTISFVDTGGATGAGPPPLDQGSTGAWHTLASLSVRRESPGVTIAADPSSANTFYLYATFGRSMAGSALGSYEFLPITVGNGGQQTVGSWTAGAQSTPTPRWQHSTWEADSSVASFVPAGVSYVYLGGGTTNGVAVAQILEVGKVAAGGDLGTFSNIGGSVKSYGQGAALAANYLYTLGDQGPSTAIRAGQIVNGGAPAVSNFNANGNGLLRPRDLPGCTLAGALIYVVGGFEGGANPAGSDVEWMVW
jgi:hypothetical protein